MIVGGRAVLAALKPPYIYGHNAEPLHAHPDSPLGQFRTSHPETPQFSLIEGSLGPGFGSSTADLIAGAYFGSEGELDSLSLQDWYRSKFKAASGADLAVQLDAVMRGEHASRNTLSGYEHGSQVRTLQISEFVKERIFILKGAPETKIRTHEDLKLQRPAIKPERSNLLVDRFTEMLSVDSMDGFSVLSEFAEYLHETDRETVGAHKIRNELSSLPGVRGVKGCGAGLNDHFIVALDHAEGSSNFKNLEECSARLGLSMLGSLGDHLW